MRMPKGDVRRPFTGVARVPLPWVLTYPSLSEPAGLPRSGRGKNQSSSYVCTGKMGALGLGTLVVLGVCATGGGAMGVGTLVVVGASSTDGGSLGSTTSSGSGVTLTLGTASTGVGLCIVATEIPATTVPTAIIADKPCLRRTSPIQSRSRGQITL